MQISLQNFASLVDSMAAAVQGACSSLIDLTVGSVLRALLEASASVALWLQYLLLQVLSMTRLSSSVGSDADSWVADFGLSRLPAIAASGKVTMTSFNPSAQAATIADGVTVRTSDGSQTFAVVNGPYVRAVGVASVDVAVVAMSLGVSGNVPAGSVIMLGTAGGGSEESDAALRARFVDYINTRAQATEQAVGYAISAVQQGISYAVQENMTAAGTVLPGNVHVIVDDGTGTPPTGLLQEVAIAVDRVRPIGTTISVSGPSVVPVEVGLSLTLTADADTVGVRSAVASAITSYVDALGVAQALRYSRIAGLCYDTSTAITNVQNVVLNGATEDIVASSGAVIRCVSVDLSLVTQAS
jgi:uncharacterized phage protein gp47/JayE